MRNNYGNFRKFLDGFCKEIEEMSKNEPSRYLAILSLSSMDSEQEVLKISHNASCVQSEIIAEFNARENNN